MFRQFVRVVGTMAFVAALLTATAPAVLADHIVDGLELVSVSYNVRTGEVTVVTRMTCTGTNVEFFTLQAYVTQTLGSHTTTGWGSESNPCQQGETVTSVHVLTVTEGTRFVPGTATLIIGGGGCTPLDPENVEFDCEGEFPDPIEIVLRPV